MTDAATQGSPATGQARPRGGARAGRALLALAAVLVLALVAIRIAAMTAPGRALAEWALDNVQMGASGALHVDGLQGDLFGDVSLRRLTLADRRGVWLSASRVRVRWNPAALIGRTVDIRDLAIGGLTLIRRPAAARAGAGGELPVSLEFERLRARVEMLPGFAERYGLYDLSGQAEVRRVGGLGARLQAASLTHAGDLVSADVDLGRSKTVRLRLVAREAMGGAIAGALGLPADQAFVVVARADGTTDAGSFVIATQSGGVSPLRASGAWTPAGGSAEGRVVLAASRLFAGLQSRLGPEVAFRLDDRRRADGLDNLNVKLTSDNLVLFAEGPAALGRGATGPGGVTASVIVRQGRRLISWPAIGALRFDGRLSGALVGPWRASGVATVADPALLGYRLGEVSGPLRIDWAGGHGALQATIAGAGGGGAGVLPALLGPTPHGSVGLDWLPDGRVLIRSLAVSGAGLDVTGSGEHGLLGGLSFKGAAKFSNFAIAHAGARGLLNARWSAAQSGAAPWSFTVDADAHEFASGIGLIDHLAGPAPTLAAHGDWKGDAIELAQLSIGGALVDLTGSGAVGGDGALGLHTAWRAKGAVDFGPVRVAGPAAGAAQISGSLGAPRLELAGDLGALEAPQLDVNGARINLTLAATPDGSVGAATLTGVTRYGAAHAQTSFSIAPGGLALTGFTAEGDGVLASGSIILRDDAPATADLAVSIGPGAVLQRGEAKGRFVLVAGAGGPVARLTMTADEALTQGGGLIIRKATLAADGPLSNLPYRLDADGFTPRGSWRADGAGVLQVTDGAYRATFDGAGRLRTADFRTVAPAVLTIDKTGLAVSAVADVGGGRASLEARQAGGVFTARASLAGVDLDLVNPDYAGRFDAQLALQGEGARLGGSFRASLTGAGERGAKAGATLGGVVKGTLAGGLLTVDSQVAGAEGLSSGAHLVLPVAASAAPFRLDLDHNRPLRGQFVADGEVGPLWSLAVGGERSLTGKAHVSVTLGGTIADPQAVGQAQLTGGALSESSSGLKLTDIGLDVRLQQASVDVDRFVAKDGDGGTLGGAGRFSLARGGASTLRLSLSKFRLLDNDLATALASGDVLVSRGADGSARIAGALTIDHADIAANPPTPSGVTPMDVVEIHREPGVGGRLSASASHAPAASLDVTIRAPRGITLKGRGLDAELSIDARVEGTTDSPVLSGTARIVSGVYDLAGKRFQFDTRSVVTLASSPDDIRLDLTATREDPSLTAEVHIEGSADRPRITLTSVPALPTDEVLSQVLFGTSASELSPAGAAELASAITSLGGGGGFDVTANLRAFAHLDRLAFGGDTAGAIVSGGKYLTKNIYVELAGGVSGPAGSVEWRPTKSISVISRVAGQGGDSQFAVRWRKDY